MPRVRRAGLFRLRSLDLERSSGATSPEREARRRAGPPRMRMRTMNILWLNSGLLLPLDKGGRLRTWHLMRHLARRHEITYLSFAEGVADGMQEVARRVETVPRRDPAKGTLRFYADAAMHLVDPLPYAVGKYRSRQFAETLHALLAETPYD